MIENARLLAEAIGWGAIFTALVLVAYCLHDFYFKPSRKSRSLTGTSRERQTIGTLGTTGELEARAATRPHPSDGNVVVLGSRRCPVDLDAVGRPTPVPSSLGGRSAAERDDATVVGGVAGNESPTTPRRPHRSPFGGWAA